MFGKLFGYVALIRAGLVQKSNEETQLLVNKLFDLHQKKNWIQELTIEAFISILTHSDKELTIFILTKLEPIFTIPVTEMDYNQFLLLLGLQYLSTTGNKIFSSAFQEIVTKELVDLFTMEQIESVGTALLQSSKKFPKV